MLPLLILTIRLCLFIFESCFDYNPQIFFFSVLAFASKQPFVQVQCEAITNKSTNLFTLIKQKANKNVKSNYSYKGAFLDFCQVDFFFKDVLFDFFLILCQKNNEQLRTLTLKLQQLKNGLSDFFKNSKEDRYLLFQQMTTIDAT